MEVLWHWRALSTFFIPLLPIQQSCQYACYLKKSFIISFAIFRTQSFCQIAEISVKLSGRCDKEWVSPQYQQDKAGGVKSVAGGRTSGSIDPGTLVVKQVVPSLTYIHRTRTPPYPTAPIVPFHRIRHISTTVSHPLSSLWSLRPGLNRCRGPTSFTRPCPWELNVHFFRVSSYLIRRLLHLLILRENKLAL